MSTPHTPAIPTLDDNGGLDLRSNALATDTEPGLLADLNAKQAGGEWRSSQAATAPFDPQYPLSGLADRRAGGFTVWTLQTVAGSPPLEVTAGPWGSSSRSRWCWNWRTWPSPSAGSASGTDRASLKR